MVTVLAPARDSTFPTGFDERQSLLNSVGHADQAIRIRVLPLGRIPADRAREELSLEMSSIWRNGKRPALRQWHLTVSTPQEIDRAAPDDYQEKAIAGRIVGRRGKERQHGCTDEVFGISELQSISMNEHSANSLEDFRSRNAA